MIWQEIMPKSPNLEIFVVIDRTVTDRQTNTRQTEPTCFTTYTHADGRVY